uniref:Uncharacterized protein n=1 Tax=Astyanax mexicanus TaxID=7994 RepID=A0A8B9HDF0_ASTMX
LFIYYKIREYDILDKRKTVTALKAGEDRAILLGLSMILFSVMMYFVLYMFIINYILRGLIWHVAFSWLFSETESRFYLYRHKVLHNSIIKQHKKE